MIVGVMRQRHDSRPFAIGDLREKGMSKPSPRHFQRLSCFLCFRRDREPSDTQGQSERCRNSANKFGIVISLGSKPMVRMRQDQFDLEDLQRSGKKVRQHHGVNSSRHGNDQAVPRTNPRFVPEKSQSGCRQVLHFRQDTPEYSAAEW